MRAPAKAMERVCSQFGGDEVVQAKDGAGSAVRTPVAVVVRTIY